MQSMPGMRDRAKTSGGVVVVYQFLAAAGPLVDEYSVPLSTILIGLIVLLLIAAGAVYWIRSAQLRAAEAQLEQERKDNERPRRASSQTGELEDLVRKLSRELAEANEGSRHQDEQIAQQAAMLQQQQAQIAQQAEQIKAQQAQIATLQTRVQELETQLTCYQKPNSSSQPELLVAVGPKAKLDIDLAALREVQRKSNNCFRFTRVLPATFVNFKNALARRRESGNPIRDVHLSVDAGPEGVEFVDGVIDGVKLSEVLQDVHVLLLAGCEADQVGDLLGVVPNVVTLREKVETNDARAMTAVFWGAISEGMDAAAAFERVLERCPAVAEFAELHQ
jgi:hypothetical protein